VAERTARGLLGPGAASGDDRFADAVTKFDVPIEPALQLLRGARNDVTTRRYETYDELREYCYLVASTWPDDEPILGTRRRARVRRRAGLAMQMTNIMRDVGKTPPWAASTCRPRISAASAIPRPPDDGSSTTASSR